MSMLRFRPIKADDIIDIQECNVKCLPENYQFKYYLYHYITWPRCSWVCLYEGNVVGYVLTKLEEDQGKLPWGHVTSLAVLPAFRGLKIAETLMRLAEESLMNVYKVSYVTLHVRVSNEAAIKLYQNKLGFKVMNIDEKYYADGENAFNMKKMLC